MSFNSRLCTDLDGSGPMIASYSGFQVYVTRVRRAPGCWRRVAPRSSDAIPGGETAGDEVEVESGNSLETPTKNDFEDEFINDFIHEFIKSFHWTGRPAALAGM